MRADIVAGTVFPDYELTDHTGERRKLSDLSGARSHGPGAQSGRILPEGSAPGRESGPTSPRDGSRLGAAPRHPRSAGPLVERLSARIVYRTRFSEFPIPHAVVRNQ